MRNIVDVSIFMLAYNHENFIAKAIEGVLKQKTSYKFEIVIGEDCSTDNTMKIIEQYQKNHPDIIKIITSEKNVGMINNSKRTIEACNGKYIAFCEGDDYWINSDKLEMQIEYLERNPDFGLTHTDNNVLYEESSHILESINKDKNEFLENHKDPYIGLLLGEYFIHTLTVVAKKDYFNDIVNSELYCDPENKQTDLILWLNILSKSKIKYFPIPTAVYRVRRGSVSKPNEMIKQLEFHESSRRIRMKFAFANKVDPKIIKEINKKYQSILLTKAYHLKSKELAFSSYKILKEYHSINYFILYHGTMNLLIRSFIEILRYIRNTGLKFIKKINKKKI